MSIKITTTYKDSENNVIETRQFDGEYNNKWKRLSTLGHPATSRPFGTAKITDFTSQVIARDWASYLIESGQVTLSRDTAPVISPEADTITLFGAIKSFGEHGDNDIVIPEPTSISDGYSTTLHSNGVPTIPVTDSSNHIAINTTFRNIWSSLSNYTVTGMYRNDTQLVIWRYYGTTYSPVCEYRVIPLDTDAEENGLDIYNIIAKYMGYGAGNPLCSPDELHEWVRFTPPRGYSVINPCVYAAPESLNGILVYDGNSDKVMIYDPANNTVIGMLSITGSYDGLSRACTPVVTALGNFFGAFSGMCYAVIDQELSFVITERGTMALYVGDTLYTSSEGNGRIWAYDPQQPFTVHNVQMGTNFDFGSIQTLGQGSFFSIGNDFYIGKCFFDPYCNFNANRPCYNDEWSVILSNPMGRIEIPIVDCAAENFANPPEGTASVLITAVLS